MREKALHLTGTRCRTRSRAEVEEIDERSVEVSIFVETESQKQILVGSGGAMVQEIGSARGPRSRRCSAARSSSSCASRSRPHWRRNETMLERFGI